MARLSFWFDFGSTYSYLTAMRIEACAKAAGVSIDYRPFLLGPIFRHAGWQSSPFLEQPAKLRYMWQDVARQAAHYGLAFNHPAPFPANGVYASRIALAALDEGWGAAWVAEVFRRVFVSAEDIAHTEILADCMVSIGQDGSRAATLVSDAALKRRLREQTEKAASLGIFGAPTFFTDDGEMFWGDDRLEAALRAAGADR
ncbi:MAG: 2-hydroxychromene-2-carboxylate isomerase [Pseudomonadota bacterium]